MPPRIKTTERRIGFVGPNSSGKTASLVSLATNLRDHDPHRFPFGKNAEVERFAEADGELDEIRPDRSGRQDWTWFDYHAHRKQLAARRWPTRTTDRSAYAFRLVRTDWKYSDALVKLFDFPGERVADFDMLRPRGDTFPAWSDHQINRLTADAPAAIEPFLKIAGTPDAAEADIVRAYKAALLEMRRDEYRPYLTPSTFLHDRQGTFLRRSDEAALERYVGLGVGEEFVPLPAGVRDARPDIAARFAERFGRYKVEVVAPLVEALGTCHGLVVFVDVLNILAAGSGRYHDEVRLLDDLLGPLDPRNSPFDKLLRKASHLVLPHGLRPARVSRVAFVAPKADLVKSEDRDRMKHLLLEVTRKATQDCRGRGVEVRHFVTAAVRSAEQLPGGRLAGSLVYGADGRPQVPGEPQAYDPSAVPDSWPGSWPPGRFAFPAVYPAVAERMSCPIEQIGLGDVFDFMCW